MFYVALKSNIYRNNWCWRFAVESHAPRRTKKICQKLSVGV